MNEIFKLVKPIISVSKALDHRPLGGGFVTGLFVERKKSWPDLPNQ